MSEYRIDTKCIQEGYSPKNGEPRVLPIVQSTTYTYDSSQAMGDLFDLKADGFFYTRLANPTPVSYTHLDVYKRQRKYHAVFQFPSSRKPRGGCSFCP